MVWAAGSGPLALAAGSYAIRIEHVEGAHALVDLVRFTWDDTPARRTTLGRVKALYR